MRILGIIPVRGSSKGIPRKNIKLLKGKPLLQYTIEAAKKSKRLTKTIVSTEDQEIADVARSLGAEVPFLRPDELARDETPTLPVIEHALHTLEKTSESFDAVCILQATTPFRDEGLIDAAIEKFIRSDADSLVSVIAVPHEYNPHWVFEPDQKGNLKVATGEQQLISRRQDLPPAYIRDGALYLTKLNVIQQKKSLYGDSLVYIENYSEHHVNLDTLEDWTKAEAILEKKNKKID